MEIMPDIFIYHAQYSSLFKVGTGTKSWLRPLSLIALVVLGLQTHASADPVPVRHLQGTVHGFLVQRTQDGHIVATGESIQVSRGDQVSVRTVFTYKDGSVDDETTVFTQHRTFKLITDHHIQKGPFFKHPMDLAIDTRTGQVITRTNGKDGKVDVHTSHITLPEDLANGMVSQLMGNLKMGAPAMTLPLLVTAPKPRIVKLVISPIGEDNFSIAGASRKALHCEIRIEIGGVAGIVAPLVGKAPGNVEIWEAGGEAPTFLKEMGSTSEDGPSLTTELASPEWSDDPKSDK